MDENEKRNVQKMIDDSLKKAMDFKTRKRGDTPTDSLQLTPQIYVDLNGARADRPKSPNVGQRYWSSQDKYPWFTDGISSWFSATGSIVAGL